MSMTLRDFLNRARFRDGNLDAMELAVVHRGAPGDLRVLPGSRITEIGAAGVTVELDEAEAFIPYHRVLEVREVGGETLWDRERGEG